MMPVFLQGLVSIYFNERIRLFNSRIPYSTKMFVIHTPKFNCYRKNKIIDEGKSPLKEMSG